MNDKLRRKLLYNSSIKEYLRETSHLLGRAISASDLLSVEDTRAFLHNATHIPGKEHSAKLLFECKSSAEFKGFFSKLAGSDPLPVYLWIPKASHCGFVKNAMMRDFWLDFPFDFFASEILTLYTADCVNKITFDWTEEENERILYVEWKGKRWSQIDY